MAKPPHRRVDWEARFYLALRRIKSYMSPDQLRRHADKDYGLSFEEALAMAYENMQAEATVALEGYGRRRRTPAPKANTADPGEDSSTGTPPTRENKS